jgi:hypothetical protein
VDVQRSAARFGHRDEHRKLNVDPKGRTCAISYHNASFGDGFCLRVLALHWVPKTEYCAHTNTLPVLLTMFASVQGLALVQGDLFAAFIVYSDSSGSIP